MEERWLALCFLRFSDCLARFFDCAVLATFGFLSWTGISSAVLCPFARFLSIGVLMRCEFYGQKIDG